MTKALSLSFVALLSVLMSGCGESSTDEIQRWVTEERAKVVGKVQPIPEPKKFVPEGYTQTQAPDPFASQNLVQALKKESGRASSASTALVAPELARRKEPLEAFPLDTIQMVGSLIKAGQPMAILKVENLLYQVRVGSHVGQNFGRVTRVTETELALREIVQDSVGEWSERNTTLQLLERSK